MRGKTLLCALSFLPATAFGQKPVIGPGGVVNAATYSSPARLAGGSIMTIFGSNLAASAQTATTIPLPTTLGGTTVSWYGYAAYLLYVSPNQINFQVPSPAGNESPGPSAAHGIVVTTAAGSSAPYTFQGGDSPIGVFTLDGSGCGAGVVQNVGSDGSLSLNSSSNSASPGQYLAVYGTGIGPVIPEPPDGYPTPFSPLTYTLGIEWAGFYDFTTYDFERNNWAGRAPGLIGVDQFNVRVPSGTREGCAVPFQILDPLDVFISQPVTVAIRNGGGPCADPPEAGYGLITWERNISTAAANVSTETDTVTVSLQASPGKQAPQAPTFTQGSLPGSTVFLGASCPIPGYRSLDAGAVTVETPGSAAAPVPSAPFSDGQVGGLTVYQATLPAGTIQSGAFTVSARGGADVGAFTSTINIPPPIQITTDMAGLVLPCAGGFVMKWTGGDPSAWVTVKQIRHLGTFDSYNAWQGLVSDGSIGITGVQPARACVGGSYPIDLVVEVNPDPSKTISFSASGLSLGGQHSWKYSYHFSAFRGD